jgi:hypothetical protein
MKYIFITAFVLVLNTVQAQELYVFTEPASNMPAKSLGVRLNTKFFKMQHDNKFSAYRLDPEIMISVSKKLMLHINGYASTMYQSNLKIEGASIYAKWRFFSEDDIHKHFRLAAFTKIAAINNPTVLTSTHLHQISDGNGGYVYHDLSENTVNNEIEIDGTNSGISSGIIATKLVNKLAVSSSLAYTYRLNNIKNKREVIVPWHAVNYTVSAGYLIYPKEYTSYKQTNINLYTEFLGSNALDKKGYFVDIAPAVQFIFNSIARLDIGYRAQLSGNTQRMSNSSFLIRVEYNFLNLFAKK